MICVRTGSRLHFGLLSLAAESAWPDIQGEPTIPARQFGGLGLMVEEPALQVHASPAATWSAVGPLAERALQIAQRLAANAPALAISPHALTIDAAPAEHVGLGAGTQLALAVAHALVHSSTRKTLPAVELAALVGRGLRSGIGVHGFARGGLLLDGGKRSGSGVAPLLVHRLVPPDWRILLCIPRQATPYHGPTEVQAFREAVRSQALAVTGDLCRLLVLGLLPALEEGDFYTFSQALHEFNARSGLLFKDVQSGIYTQPETADLIAWIQSRGLDGVGQSSWGPTVFCLTHDEEQAGWLQVQTTNRLGDRYNVVVTRPATGGARLTGTCGDRKEEPHGG